MDKIVIEDAELPAEYNVYETMIILRPNMSEEERWAAWRTAGQPAVMQRHGSAWTAARPSGRSSGSWQLGAGEQSE